MSIGIFVSVMSVYTVMPAAKYGGCFFSTLFSWNTIRRRAFLCLPIAARRFSAAGRTGAWEWPVYGLEDVTEIAGFLEKIF